LCQYLPFALTPLASRFKSLTGLVRRHPLSLDYYRNRALSAWMADKLATGISRVFVFSSAMAQFVPEHDDIRMVMDFADIDSDKWRQYAESKNWPLSAVYRRESRLLLAWEKEVAARSDAALFVSPDEAALFRQLAPAVSNKVHHFNNGVDFHFFDPAGDYPNPFGGGQKAIVFTGAMDYWANVDAVRWFAGTVFPRLLERCPDAQFHIVGGKPAAGVRALAGRPQVHVTGRVADIRPYIAHAAVVVAPIRIARGIQNKVLEAMAMARPTVTTPPGAEGIENSADRELIVRDSAAAFADSVADLIAGGGAAIGKAARRRIISAYDWQKCLGAIPGFFGDGGSQEGRESNGNETIGRAE